MCSRVPNTVLPSRDLTHWALSEFMGSNPSPGNVFQQNTRLPAPRFCDCDGIKPIARDKVLIMLLCSRGLKIKAFGEEKCYTRTRLGNVSLISLRQSGIRDRCGRRQIHRPIYRWLAADIALWI